MFSEFVCFTYLCIQKYQFSSAVLGSIVRLIRVLVRVADRDVSSLAMLICCQILLTGTQSRESVDMPLLCHPSPSLITCDFRSSEVRRLFLDLVASHMVALTHWVSRNSHTKTMSVVLFPVSLRKLVFWGCWNVNCGHLWHRSCVASLL